MTPKELAVIYETIEHIAENAYRLGQADATAQKTLETKHFRLSKARKLEIKTLLIKATTKR